jgi:uncharacterized membrane protein
VSAGALGLAFFYLGLSTGDVSKVKPIAFALAPTVAAIGAFLVLGEEFTVRKLLGLLLLVGGILVLTLPERAPG